VLLAARLIVSTLVVPDGNHRTADVLVVTAGLMVSAMATVAGIVMIVMSFAAALLLYEATVSPPRIAFAPGRAHH
jgi:hypothetical protein